MLRRALEIEHSQSISTGKQTHMLDFNLDSAHQTANTVLTNISLAPGLKKLV